MKSKKQKHIDTLKILLKSTIECAAGAKILGNRALYKADLPSEINSIECAAGAKILGNRALYKADLPSEIDSIECAAGAKFLRNRASTMQIYLLKSTVLSAPQARNFAKSLLYKADLPSDPPPRMGYRGRGCNWSNYLFSVTQTFFFAAQKFFFRRKKKYPSEKKSTLSVTIDYNLEIAMIGDDC